MQQTSSLIRSLQSRRRSWIGEQPAWLLLSAVLIAVLVLPAITIVALALRPSDGALAHLTRTILPQAIIDTLVLLAGAGVATLLIGTTTAWLVTMYRFPGRALLDRLLVLPLAMPVYLLAYIYVDALDFSGPVQSGLRHLFGWTALRAFPDIRSRGGAILITALALYPYVYLSARASFIQQSVCVLEVARTLGCSSTGAFFAVALPLARPALAAGVALVLMECMNEFGAMQHLGVSTLTVAIYTTWLERGSLPGAAQLAVVALGFIAVLILLERAARGGGRVHHTTGRYRAIPFQDLYGWRAAAAIVACVLPVLFGFVLPMLALLRGAWTNGSSAFASGFVKAAANSVLLAVIAAIAAVTLAVILAYAHRVSRSKAMAIATVVAGLGYALPGTVLALGLKLPLSSVDTWVDQGFRQLFGVSSGLLLSGTLIIVVLAFVIRFLSVSLGAIDAGLERLSPNLDAAARTLGETATSALWRVHLPLLVPVLGTAGLLVFVDAMKELPATLLLRPFNFETLSTHVYSLAALEQFEAACLGALAIVLVGLVPVLLLHQTIAGGRAGQSSAR